jgi:hypothetical protein
MAGKQTASNFFRRKARCSQISADFESRAGYWQRVGANIYCAITIFWLLTSVRAAIE